MIFSAHWVGHSVPLVNHSTDVDTIPCMHDTRHIMLLHMEPNNGI